MSRERRYIESGSLYEICFRAKDSLPFVAYRVIALFIKSALARAQRDDKVELCHDIWEGSHPHLLLIVKDSQECVNFYTEIQKKITDYLKKLLGLEHAQIWEGRPAVIKVDDLETAREKIAYLYANPAQDNVATSIDKFIGYSSWSEFQACKDSLLASTQESVPWIRLPSISAIPSPVLSLLQDSNLVQMLTKRNKKKHILRRTPNAWMKIFNVTSDEEAQKVNNDILALLRDKEKAAAKLREQEKKTVLSAAAQRSTPILKPHTPKKKGPKINFQSSCKERRREFAKFMKKFNQLCRYCYQQWKEGNIHVAWPPGAFRPPMPPLANALNTG